ncbi:MAG: lipoyl synthase [Gammaproteobacteria bacterium]|nr:lipoyl synthase [Gammaproteobacteria bacterium]
MKVSAASPASGAKYQTPQGTTAIKDGIKLVELDTPKPRLRKPDWLRVRIGGDAGYKRVQRVVREHALATVCEESHCPNIGECWSHGTATLMLMGAVCTRACRFCAVDTGNPRGWLDPDEPAHAAESVALMNLGYVVLTSVDRDDLADGGAEHYARCIRAIRKRCPETTIEALTPDFAGNEEAVATLVDSGVDVFAQNLETVRRLTHKVRDPRAGYDQTLNVLDFAKRYCGIVTKTGLMLGLGESDDEIRECLTDIRARDVDLLTLGQYLQPTPNHLPVVRWVHPDQFARYRERALAEGFREVASGPLVRSSYRADQLARNFVAP